MPAAAVIPAPIAYIKVVAVKKLVVESCDTEIVLLLGVRLDWIIFYIGVKASVVYLEKIRVFKAGICLNTLAWNNRIGLWFCFVGFQDQSND